MAVSLLRHPSSLPFVKPQLLCRRDCHTATTPTTTPPPPHSLLTSAGPKRRSKRTGRLAVTRSKGNKVIERFVSSVAALLFRRKTPDPLDLAFIALDAAAAAAGGGGGGVWGGNSSGGGWWFDRWRRRRSRGRGLVWLLVMAAATAMATALEKGSGDRVLTPAVQRFGGAVGKWRRNKGGLMGLVLGFVLSYWSAAFRRRGDACLRLR